MKSTICFFFVLLGVPHWWFCFQVDAAAAVDQHAKITQLFICQDSRAQLTCPRGQVIKVANAKYGRTAGQSVCPTTLNDGNNCSALTLPLVRCLCHDKNSCMLSASNDLFGDPCNSTSKYLQVDYSCMGAYKLKCGNHSCPMECPVNTTLNFEFASYGGRNSSLAEPSNVVKGFCTYTSTYFVLNDCQGENRCVFNHPTDRFNDDTTCFDHLFKYLEIRYKCV